MVFLKHRAFRITQKERCILQEGNAEKIFLFCQETHFFYCKEMKTTRLVGFRLQKIFTAHPAFQTADVQN